MPLKAATAASGKKAGSNDQFRVSYKTISSRKDARKTILLAMANIGVEVGFLAWLLLSLVKPIWDETATIGAAFIALLVCIFIIESFRLVSIISFSMSALMARDPLPVQAKPGSRVAFTTTIVPSKEPFEMVRKTLEAMLNVRHNGPLDVWLLDEGNDPDIKKACLEMGVRHFSRKGIDTWNMESGRFKARTKHGNHNSWLVAHGALYDYVLSVDSDHIPHTTFGERMLGYFRDPDVAFVVGPQVYGNTDTVIARGAESQSYVFQATIQRAANAYNVAMFVGTNHAYRVKTMMQIGGFQDSITEDLLTGMKIHSSRNPLTGKYWKSVYTPDVLAIGEGPSSWTDFFTQQLRWARGADETLLKHFARMFVRLPWGARLHYGLIIWCYPAAALTWTVGIVVSMLYLFLGTTGVGLQDKTWLALYIDVLAAQVILYAWLRRYNVSPHEEKKSFGISGIMFSIFAAPVYTVALFNTLLRRTSSFVVTAKGDTTSPDNWMTFKYHIFWTMLISSFLAYTIAIGNTHPNVKIWSVIALTTCLTPLVMWRVSIWPQTVACMRRFWRAPIRPARLLRLDNKLQKGIEI